MATRATGLPRQPAAPSTACPCGTGTSYDECCGRLHRGDAVAETAEQLMRSRYSAYAVGDLDHVFRTWHPRTRPVDVAQSPMLLEWTALEVLASEAGQVDDQDGVVEFRAHYRTASGSDSMTERSSFTRRRGQWVYVDGESR